MFLMFHCDAKPGEKVLWIEVRIHYLLATCPFI